MDFHILLGRQIVAPWIMVDELIYSELAKSFAASAHFQIRGVTTHSFGFVYPVLIAPAWRIEHSIPAAYALAKGINSVLMSLVAIPVYFLGRRMLSSPLALIGALLAVLTPSLLYTGVIMTENAFYPLFALVMLVLVVTLERPTAGRQIGLLVLVGVAYLTRAQAVALVPAIAVAPVLLGLIDRDLRGRIRAFAPLYAILIGGAALASLATVARAIRRSTCSAPIAPPPTRAIRRPRSRSTHSGTSPSSISTSASFRLRRCSRCGRRRAPFRLRGARSWPRPCRSRCS